MISTASFTPPTYCLQTYVCSCYCSFFYYLLQLPHLWVYWNVSVTILNSIAFPWIDIIYIYIYIYIIFLMSIGIPRARRSSVNGCDWYSRAQFPSFWSYSSCRSITQLISSPKQRLTIWVYLDRIFCSVCLRQQVCRRILIIAFVSLCSPHCQ